MRSMLPPLESGQRLVTGPVKRNDTMKLEISRLFHKNDSAFGLLCFFRHKPLETWMPWKSGHPTDAILERSCEETTKIERVAGWAPSICALCHVRKDMRTPITVIIWQWLHGHPPTRTTQLNLSWIANSWTSWQVIGFCLCFKPLCFWTIFYTAIITKTCTNYYRKKWKNKTLKTSESYPTTCIRRSF